VDYGSQAFFYGDVVLVGSTVRFNSAEVIKASKHAMQAGLEWH
jgi:hypothetical protein